MTTTKMTRAEYIAAESPRHDAHRTYYAQYVTEGIKAMVRSTFGTAVIKASDDPHFNDIALKRWDTLAARVNSAALAAAMKENGDYLTLSGQVCILKEAAQQIREE